MKKLNLSKGNIMIIAVLCIVALAGLGFGTYAFFTATATSERNEITSGNLKMKANGANSNFRFDIASAGLQPGDYITTGTGNVAEINVKNKGTLDMIFMSSFRFADGKSDNFFANGLIFEQLTRTLKDASGAVVTTTNYIENDVLDASLDTYKNSIDKYNINGKLIQDASRPADNLISVREWIEFCGKKDAGLAKIYVGKLQPGYTETWTLKIKFHKTCGNRYNIKNGFNLFLDYSAEATQNDTEAIVALLANQSVITLDFNNNNGDFTQLATKWNNEL